MKLTRNDIQNILILLNRVQLKGAEAKAFVEICEKLNLMLNIQEPEKVE